MWGVCRHWTAYVSDLWPHHASFSPGPLLPIFSLFEKRSHATIIISQSIDSSEPKRQLRIKDSNEPQHYYDILSLLCSSLTCLWVLFGTFCFVATGFTDKLCDVLLSSMHHEYESSVSKSEHCSSIMVEVFNHLPLSTLGWISGDTM